MPYRIAILSLLGIILLIAACNMNSREDAMKMSSELTSVNDSLSYFGKKWTDELEIAVNTSDFSKLGDIRSEIGVFIDRKLVHLGSMKDVGGSEDFRHAELEILKYERDTILPASAVFESFGAGTTDEEISSAYQALLNTTQREGEKLQVVYALRDKYAEKNDFPKPVDK